MQINNNYSVLIPAPTGGDVVVTGEIISITTMPPIDVRRVQNLGAGYVMFPFAERGGNWTITAPTTPIASGSYGYTVTQTSPGQDKSLFRSTPLVPKQNQVIVQQIHTTNAGGESRNTLINAVTKGLNSYINPNVGLQVTNTVDSTSAGTKQNIVAIAGAPVLNVQDRSTPPADWGAAGDGVNGIVEILGTAGTISGSTNATPTVVTIPTVQTSITAGTLALNSFYPVTIGGTVTSGSGVKTGYFIGKLLSATTVALYYPDGTGVVGSATAETTATLSFPIATSLGTVNDLIALGANPSLLTTGHVYGIFQINFSQVESGGNDFPALTFSWTVYVDYTASTTNYTNFVSAIASAFGALYLA